MRSAVRDGRARGTGGLSNLAHRRLDPERMDSPDLPEAQHLQALRGISRINILSRTVPTLWPVLRSIALTKPIRILDVACGGGDVALGLQTHARREHLPVEVHACDISPVAIDFAKNLASKRRADTHFFQHNVIADGMPQGYDVIVSTLFLHHLHDEDAKAFLESASSAAPVLLVSDLIRSRPGLALAYLACYTLTPSPVVHIDGPQSVRAAFTLDEVSSIAQHAGMRSFQLRRRWPCRFLLEWRKDMERGW